MQKKARVQQHWRMEWIVAAIIVGALLVKFFWTLFAYDMPLGFDAGFYRYLFVKHALGFPPFVIEPMDAWAKAHPIGLFFFSTLFIRLGVPVDWFVGWIWNLFPVILAATFSAVIARRYGRMTGICTLIAALLSVAYFDGFAAMYWKTFASLLWYVLACRALERRSWLAVPFGVFALATHHQTGLLFGLTFLSWVILSLLPFTRSTEKTFLTGMKISLRNVLTVCAFGLAIAVLGLLTYLPVWKDAVLSQLPALLGRADTASGNFPDVFFYLRYECILLLLGAYGFVQNIRRERWTLWQLSVIWCVIFIALKLLFYRRFFLQLDFFLMPFAAMTMVEWWKRQPRAATRSAIAIVCIIQLGLMAAVAVTRAPTLDNETFAAVRDVRYVLQPEGIVIGLDPDSAAALRGWMTKWHVGGPGLFELPWTQEQWEKFLFGTHEDRAVLIGSSRKPVLLFVSPTFLRFYGPIAQQFLADPCFTQNKFHPMIYFASCRPTTSAL